MKSIRLKFSRVLLGITLTSQTILPVIAQNEALPELGDSSEIHLSSMQESMMGQAFFRNIIQSKNFIEEDELQFYLQSMGEKIATYTDLRGAQLTFSLLKNNDPNAFAVPGGYITFNTGLLTATENESELASVVGHEISHLTQRHLPRLFAKANENKIPALAATLASVLAGGQASIAGLTLTTASLRSSQLRYTRQFEREADSQGIQLLAKAGYDPKAMNSFFGKLERYARHDSNEMPEFLRTHPISFARMTEAQSRASLYPAINHQSSFEYYLAKAKIIALYIKRQDNPIQYFQEKIKLKTDFPEAAAYYGLVLAYTETRNYEDAYNYLNKLKKSHKNHPWIIHAEAKLQFQMGNKKKALATYQRLNQQYPQRLYTSLLLADAYIHNGELQEAKKTLKYQIRRHPNNYRLHEKLAKVLASLGDMIGAYQSDIERYANLGNYKKAIDRAKQAYQTLEDKSGYLGKSIQSRQKEMERLLSLQKNSTGS